MSEKSTESKRAQVVRLGEELPQEFRHQYWNQVKQTLQKVFGANESLADQARSKLERLEREKKQQQTLFFHASPLEIASDLTGNLPISPEQKAIYQELLKHWTAQGRGEDLELVQKVHVKVLHPEA